MHTQKLCFLTIYLATPKHRHILHCCSYECGGAGLPEEGAGQPGKKNHAEVKHHQNPAGCPNGTDHKTQGQEGQCEQLFLPAQQRRD